MKVNFSVTNSSVENSVTSKGLNGISKHRRPVSFAFSASFKLKFELQEPSVACLRNLFVTVVHYRYFTFQSFIFILYFQKMR